MLRKIIEKAILMRNKLFFYIKNYLLIRKGLLVCDLKSLYIFQSVYLYRHGGNYTFGNHVQFGYYIGGRYKKGYCELQARSDEAEIIIKDYSAINNNFLAIACKKIEIGEHCRIGAHCEIMDFDAHNVNPELRSKMGKVKEVIIGNNVWIGNNVMILSGVSIGNHSIIAAGAVVTEPIPDNVIAGGVPAKVIKKIGSDNCSV